MISSQLEAERHTEGRKKSAFSWQGQARCPDVNGRKELKDLKVTEILEIHSGPRR